MRNIQKAFALLLALLLALPGLAFARAFSDYQLAAASNEEITAGLSLWQYDLQGRANPTLRQRLYVVEYQPGINPQLVPRVISREDLVPMLEPVRDSMLWLEAQGEVRPLLGINGDFFDISAGGGLGLSIRGGRLYMSGEFPGSWSLGFDAGGRPRLGQPELQMTLSVQRQGQGVLQAQPIDALNCLRADVPRGGSQPRNAFDARQDNRLVLYTPDWGTSTNAQPGGVEVLLDLPGAVRPTGQLQGTVREVLVTEASATPPAIPLPGMALTPGTAVLSATGQAADVLNQLQPGDAVTIDTGISPDWADIVTTVGGGPPTDTQIDVLRDAVLAVQRQEVST